MSKIPVLKLEGNIIVSVQTELHDKQAEALLHDITEEFYRTRAKGLLIDVTALEIVDSFLGRLIGDIASIVTLMGGRVVLVGIQPAVAITLAELGIELHGVQKALNMERGLNWLRENSGEGK